MRTRRSQSSSDLVPSNEHQSVLLHEAIEQLAIQPDDIVIDGTLGGAGHAKALADTLSEKGVLIGFDLDVDAIERARVKLVSTGKKKGPQVHLVEANFRTLESTIRELGIPLVSKVLFDLGWSAYQLQAGRGFSFLADEPLLMTYSKSESALTAATIVNTWGEESIADIIYGWGEEKYSRRIAKAIVEQRVKKPFKTALDLALLIKQCVPSVYRYGRIHPATRTFQALRIAVNDEIGALTEGLNAAWRNLAPGGRIAVITFHSIEDRAVKQLFVQWEKEEGATRITRKPTTPSDDELVENPRARSAKLRVIEKTISSYEENYQTQ